MSTPSSSAGDVLVVSSAAAVLEARLPAHAAGLMLEHNEHLVHYETLEQYLAQLDLAPNEWAAPCERERCLAAGSIWVLWWYPHTPVGVCRLAGATLATVLTAAARSTR